MADTTRNRVVGDELAAIVHEHGTLTPELVLDRARDATNPLHEFFTWDMRDAAHKHNLDEARALIRSVTVVITTSDRILRTVQYVRDPDAATQQQGYVNVETMIGDVDASRRALLYEVLRANALLQRARRIAIALDLEDDVDKILNGLTQLQTSLRLSA